jgi:hypothetical protein
MPSKPARAIPSLESMSVWPVQTFAAHRCSVPRLAGCKEYEWPMSFALPNTAVLDVRVVLQAYVVTKARHEMAPVSREGHAHLLLLWADRSRQRLDVMWRVFLCVNVAAW